MGLKRNQGGASHLVTTRPATSCIFFPMSLHFTYFYLIKIKRRIRGAESIDAVPKDFISEELGYRGKEKDKAASERHKKFKVYLFSRAFA